ncbi:MAG: hypothetical protein OER04_01545 [Cyclobacteriaceae bacterium]|nr:hypothetical protein [Cyclobacteriaceae bacterium]
MIKNASILIGLLLMWSCTRPAEAPAAESASEEPEVKEITYDTSDPSSVITAIEAAAGGWDQLWSLNDVEFTYSYHSPSDDKLDLSTERYLFDSEHSWAKYTSHQINVFPDQEGEVIQCYDGKEKAEVSFNGEKQEDQEAVGLCHFLRKANFFWFVMNFRLDDPGTIHEYLGQEEVNGVTYDKLKVSYDSEVTGKEQNDTFVLFVNPETKLVDRFLFSLPVWEIMEPVLLMEVEYSEVEGLMLPTLRRAYMPDEEGQYPDTPMLIQTTSNVKFNNGFTAEDFVL